MRFVLFCAFVLRFAQGSTSPIPTPISICGSEDEIVLESEGDAASSTIILEANANKSECHLKVAAPKSHVVNLQFLEVIDQPAHNKSAYVGNMSSCVMRIFLPDNPKTPFWRGDPCSGDQMPDVDLLTAEFNLLWEPPINPATRVFQKTIVLTAVGSGPFCKDPFQHTCMRIGRIPMLCISDHLLCDGVQNCPKTSTNSDEDPKLCSTAKNAWENLVVELVKKYRPPDADRNFDLKENATDGPSEWFEWQLVKKNSTKKPEVVSETHSATESISAMLNKYGPWGYLMMGLLICGTVLFFCGLWECCCKRPKPEVDPPPSTTPTTVLIMNCEQGAAPPMPPQYDDLDLPPSYTTLFPLEEGRYTTISEEEEAAVPSSSSGGDDEKNEEIDQSSSADCVQPVTVVETVQINHDNNSTSQQEPPTDLDSV
ncbi:uncharacterized protein LOC109545539 [Dendroctonus ponderosae]|uniref:CUB domain-containing protein n=1 Tax=Dendroctonus ponderosae TaxID=77166 RepID=A0AAR5P0U5_DENPD|nr:uncharacterized protein LOC109545539 [Dendroctonus ponderosae]